MFPIKKFVDVDRRNYCDISLVRRFDVSLLRQFRNTYRNIMNIICEILSDIISRSNVHRHKIEFLYPAIHTGGPVTTHVEALQIFTPTFRAF